jgi:hypothetical protein
MNIKSTRVLFIFSIMFALTFGIYAQQVYALPIVVHVCAATGGIFDDYECGYYDYGSGYSGYAGRFSWLGAAIYLSQ